MVIAVSADVLADNGARQSAGTVLTIKFDMFSMEFHWFSQFHIGFWWPDDIFENDWRNRMESYVRVNLNIYVMPHSDTGTGQ